MKVSYFIQIREEGDAVDYLKKLTSSDFFLSHEISEMIISFPNGLTNASKIKRVLNGKCKVVLLYAKHNYTFNDAFFDAVEIMNGDICIMLDSGVKNFTQLLKKCIEKHEKGARLVWVKRKYNGIKSFFHRMGHAIYSAFCKIFAGKSDEDNVISLGLIDRYMLDLMRTLPQKRCLLKNVAGLYDVTTATIYVDDKKLPPDCDTKYATQDIRNFITFTILTPIFIALIVLLNLLVHPHTLINLSLTLLAIFSFILACFSLPKHKFTCRNYPLDKVKIEQEKLEKK